MVYAYDQWLQMPTKDLFDTQMMLASVNAAKDMYEKGLEEMKEFNEKYGDFLSPIESDMKWHQENVIGKVSNAINALYDAGIDPVRSKEGRGLLSRIRANINYGRIAQNVQAAKNAEQYQKSANDLIKSNLYDPEYEKWRLGGKTLSNWDTAKDGMWTETSARPFRDVDSIVEPWVKNLEPSYDAAYTKAQNDGYDYDTVGKERIMAVIDDALPEFTRTSEGAYYRYLAEQAAGGDKKAGDALLKEWLYNRASDHTQVNRTINPERKMALEDYYDKIQTQRQANKEIEVYQQKKIIDRMYGDGDGDGTKLSYDPLTRIYQDAVGNIFGGEYDIYQPGALDVNGNYASSEQEKGIKQRQIDLTKNISPEAVVNTFSRDDAITFDMFAGAADAMDRRTEGSISAISTDVDRLLSTNQLVNKTVTSLGRQSVTLENARETVRSGEKISSNNYISFEITPTGKVYGALMRDGRFKTYAQVNVTRYDDKNNVMYTTPMWYDLRVQSEKVANYEQQPAILRPDLNDHSFLSRSRRIAYEAYKTKPTTDDFELVPGTQQPKQ